VAATVQRREAGIEIQTGQLRVFVHLATLRMQVTSADGRVGLRGFRPRFWVHDRPVVASEAVADIVDEVQTPLGAVTRISLICRSAARIDLTLHLDVAEDWPGLALEVMLENRGEASARINAIEPVSWSRRDEGELALPGDPKDLRFYRMGYQSWSPAGYAPLASRSPRPRIPLLKTVHWSPFAPPPGRGRHVSDFATQLSAPGEAGVTLGFLTHRRFLNHIALAQRGGQLEELAATVPTEGLRLGPQETLSSERLWLGLDAAGTDGIAEWATRTGIEMEAPVPGAVGSGWCSWYQYFTKLRAEDIETNVRTLAELDTGLETVQIDDGYQAAVGDWLEWSDGFPDGVAPLARAIRGHGFQAGLWLAPFLVSRASKLAAQHPDWILRGANGRPRTANFNPAWEGRVCHALDPTHPEVLDWLRDVASTVRSYGFDYLKLDFLYAGALAGQRHDASAASAQAYRRGIGALREGAGEDALLLGCGAPLGPSIGLFEAMRIGPDVAPSWSAPLADLAFGLRAAPSAENSVRNILARAPLHQRLWVNDPDCVLLRDRDTKLSESEVQTLVGAVAVSGGLLVASDDLANLSKERRALLRRLLPVLRTPPEVHGPDGMLTRLSDGAALLYRANLSRRSQIPSIDLEALGFGGPTHVYDVWGDHWLGLRSGRFDAPALPPHGSLLLRLTPARGTAAVVGSSLHVGALETGEIRTNGDRVTQLELRLAGQHSGRVLLAPPQGEPVPVHVGFRDSVEITVAGTGVEESAEIPDS